MWAVARGSPRLLGSGGYQVLEEARDVIGVLPVLGDNARSSNVEQMIADGRRSALWGRVLEVLGIRSHVGEFDTGAHDQRAQDHALVPRSRLIELEIMNAADDVFEDGRRHEMPRGN